jgi:hypothetical protein
VEQYLHSDLCRHVGLRDNFTFTSLRLYVVSEEEQKPFSIVLFPANIRHVRLPKTSQNVAVRTSCVAFRVKHKVFAVIVTSERDAFVYRLVRFLLIVACIGLTHFDILLSLHLPWKWRHYFPPKRQKLYRLVRDIRIHKYSKRVPQSTTCTPVHNVYPSPQRVPQSTTCTPIHNVYPSPQRVPHSTTFTPVHNVYPSPQRLPQFTTCTPVHNVYPSLQRVPQSITTHSILIWISYPSLCFVCCLFVRVFVTKVLYASVVSLHATCPLHLKATWPIHVIKLLTVISFSWSSPSCSAVSRYLSYWCLPTLNW